MTPEQLTFPNSSQTKPSLKNRLLCALIFGFAAFLYMVLFLIVVSDFSWSDLQTMSWSELNLDLEGGFFMLGLPALGSAVTALFLATHFRKDMERGYPFLFRGFLTSLAVTATAFVINALDFAGMMRELTLLPAIMIVGGAIYLLPALPMGALAGWVYWRFTERSLRVEEAR